MRWCPWLPGGVLGGRPVPRLLPPPPVLPECPGPRRLRGGALTCGPFLLADSKGLSNPAEVEALREKVYASLEAYCKHKYPEQPGR